MRQKKFGAMQKTCNAACMKKVMKCLPLLTVFISQLFFTNCYSQLWKEYADSAKALNNRQQTDSALALYYNAKDVLQKDSSQSNSYAEVCTGIGDIYIDLAKYDSAEKYYIISKNIGEKIFGKENMYYASSCNSLGNLYKDLGAIKKS